MRFKQFILEEDEQRAPTTKEVTQEQLYTWIKRNSPHYLNALVGGHDVAIFRGMKVDSDYALGDSSTFRRKAANTTNEIQSFIATSEKWKHFPSRERAYICATIKIGAHGHGNIFLVIPADTAKIGVCPEIDFWPSFRDGLRKTSVYDVAELNDVIKLIRGKTDLELPEDNAVGLRRDLRTITADKLLELSKEVAVEYGSSDEMCQNLKTIAREMKRDWKDNFEDFLEEALDPRTNDFKWMTVEDYAGYENREVWIEGKAAFIMMQKRELPELIDQLKSDLYNFEV